MITRAGKSSHRDVKQAPLLLALVGLIAARTGSMGQAGGARPDKVEGSGATGKSSKPAVDFTKPLTLDAVVKVALGNQPTLAIARTQFDSGRARVVQAQARYLPTVQPRLQYTEQVSAFAFQGQTQSQTIKQTVQDITLNQTLFDSGRRELGLLQARYGSRADEFNLRDVRQDVILNVTVAYYELLRRRELLRVAKASVDRGKTTLDSTKAFVEAGTAARKDIFQAQADYDNAQVQLLQAQNNVRVAETQLKNAMGILTLTPIAIADSSAPAPDPVAEKRPLEEFLKDAFEKRLDLKRADATVASNRASTKIAKIESGFQFSANLQEGYRLVPNANEIRSLSAVFSYPLFDGGRAAAQIKEAQAGLENSRQQLEVVKQNVSLAVEQAYLNRELARAQLVASQEALKAAQVNFTSAQEAQKEGAGTILDVITAQTQLITSETNTVQAIYDFYVADARLKRAIGDNDPYFTSIGGK